MATVVYLLADVYKFTREGVSELTNNFYATVRNPAVRCRYLQEETIFEIECPRALGDRPFRQFAALMKLYVEQNLNSEERKVFRAIESQPGNEISPFIEKLEDIDTLIRNILSDNKEPVDQGNELLDLRGEDEDETGHPWSPSDAATDVEKVFSQAVIETIIQDTGCALNVDREQRSVIIKGSAHVDAARKLSRIERNAHRKTISSHFVHTENLTDASTRITLPIMLDNPYVLSRTLVEGNLAGRLPGLRTCQLVRYDEGTHKLEVLSLLDKPPTKMGMLPTDLFTTWSDLKFPVRAVPAREKSYADTPSSMPVAAPQLVTDLEPESMPLVNFQEDNNVSLTPLDSVHKLGFTATQLMDFQGRGNVSFAPLHPAKQSHLATVPLKPTVEEEIVILAPTRTRKSRFDVPPPEAQRQVLVAPPVEPRKSRFDAPPPAVQESVSTVPLVRARKSRFDVAPSTPITMTTEDPTPSQRNKDILQWASAVPATDLDSEVDDHLGERIQVVSEPETRRVHKTIVLQKGNGGKKPTKAKKKKKQRQVDTSGLPKPDALPEPYRNIAKSPLDHQAESKSRKHANTAGMADMLQILEHARSSKGDIDIEVQLGQILINDQVLGGRTNDLMTANGVRQDSFQEQIAIQEASGGIVVHFSRRLTTDLSEACMLAMPHAFSEPCLSEAYYEFVILDKHNEEVQIEIRPTSEEPTRVRSASQEIGAVHLHYPRRIHDARFVVSVSESYDVTDAIRSFIATVEVDVSREGEDLMDLGDEPVLQMPKVMWRHQPNLSVLSVMAKRRVHHRHVNEDFTLQVTETRLLEQAYLIRDPTAWVARSARPADMIEKQCLWFEASLHVVRNSLLDQNQSLQLGDEAGWKPEEVLKEETMKDLSIVAAQLIRLDGVGSSNQGPRGSKQDLLDIEARREARRQENSGAMMIPSW